MPKNLTRRTILQAAMASPLAALSLGAVAKGSFEINESKAIRGIFLSTNQLTHWHSPTWCERGVVGDLSIVMTEYIDHLETPIRELHHKYLGIAIENIHWIVSTKYDSCVSDLLVVAFAARWVSHDRKHEYKAFWSRNGSHRSIPADLRGDES